MATAAKLKDLYDQALSEYRTRCLWNCSPSYSVEGLTAIAEQLKTYGDMKAWKLAQTILEELSHAN